MFSERLTAVVVGGMRVLSAYQPVWGTNENSMIEYRRALESQIAIGGSESLVIAGDFNANVGKWNAREVLCGKYGVGRDLVDWCEENGLEHVNSYMKHARRGTWFNLRYGRWYEMDGFIVRKGERHRIVMSLKTLSEWGLSDHRGKSDESECEEENMASTRKWKEST